ncbi:TPA: hypothetical protein MIM64_26650 [Klebsiella variicola]|nr:hypothetical protein [Klebsiella variicola]
MPPSGTTSGTAPDRPAALRLPVLGGRRFSVGRIRHLCRHPALPRVRRLAARRRCACRAYGGIPQASSVVARLSVVPAGNAPSTTLSHQNHASNIPPTFSESSCWSWVPLTFAVCSLSTWPPVT